MPTQYNNNERYLKIRELARQMRRNATEAKACFWEKVREGKLLGLKWNRQFIIQCRVDTCTRHLLLVRK